MVRPAALLRAVCVLAALQTGSPAIAQQKAGEWATLPPMPTMRSEISAAVVDGRIYVGGGLTDEGGLAEFEVFDIATGVWTELTDLPQRRHHAAMAAVGGKVYVSGGYMSSFNEGLRDLRAYDPEAGTWRRVASPPQARVAHAMAAVGGRLYVVGGLTADPHSLWSYDPAADAWTEGLARMPTAREHVAAVGFGTRLYVIGGRWSRVNLSVLEIYDTVTNTWSRGTPMPSPAGGLTAAAVGGRIHVTGGEDLYSSNTYGNHYAYDPATDTWEVLPPLPTPRHGLASAGIDGVFYVIGGATLAGGGTYTSLSDLVEAYRAE